LYTTAFDSIPLVGKLNVNEHSKFACIQLTEAGESRATLQSQLLQAFRSIGLAERYKVDPAALTVPVPPAGDTDIGPHVTLNHFTETVNWPLLKTMEGRTMTIDRVDTSDIRMVGLTRTAQKMFLVRVESQDLVKVRQELGMSDMPVNQQTMESYAPHITVAVVL
jgi:hypothetical protein